MTRLVTKGELLTMSLTDPTLVPNILAISLFVATVFISLRASYIYSQTRSPRLFILGLSMGVISLTAADNLVANFITIPFNTYWFLYLGQTISYFFIWASFFRSSDEYLHGLMRWHIIGSLLALGLLLASPAIPPFPHDNVLRAIMSASRSIPCFGIFCCYIITFMRKNARFSFLMSLAFLLLTIGPWIIVEKYFVATGGDILDGTGDILRLAGLVVLLVAVLWG
jgi:hypothetical protein